MKTLFDEILYVVNNGDFNVITTRLNPELTHLRIALSEGDWQQQVKQPLLAHPLHRLLLEDPNTQRAYAKPRGYAGDAVMLDYLYSQRPPATISAIGVGVFSVTTTCKPAAAVLWRAKHLAAEMDSVAEQFPQAQVLSLACGHLREAMFSTALASGRIATLQGVDQDTESLAVVQQDYGHLPVRLRQGNLKGLLKGRIAFSGLHLAYAAGLYDYLAEPVAAALTAQLFAALAPSGKLIVPNFLVDNSWRGYMEGVMDWNLILRTPAEIERLGHALPPKQVASRRYYQDPMEMVGYLEVVKAG